MGALFDFRRQSEWTADNKDGTAIELFKLMGKTGGSPLFALFGKDKNGRVALFIQLAADRRPLFGDVAVGEYDDFTLAVTVEPGEKIIGQMGEIFLFHLADGDDFYETFALHGIRSCR